MYYTYDEIVEISLHYEKNSLKKEVTEKINQIKKELGIYIYEPLKKTIINKQQDYCGIICKSLNKISEKNYEKLKIDIFEMLEPIEKQEDINIITNKIFSIASSNVFLSKIFSKLYKELIDKNEGFMNVFEENFQKHCELLSNIKYRDPNTDYDGYCNYVKQIEYLKSGLVFFSNLLKEQIGSKVNIMKLCSKLLDLLKEEMKHKEKMEYKDELLQSLFILIKETYNYIYMEDIFKNIKDDIIFIKNHPNCTQKLKFKCMDINDFIKKQLNK
tara:strand:- start:325 stop:1140 length:816 start_codon:yes stop_codon:yes gene_type:complete